MPRLEKGDEDVTFPYSWFKKKKKKKIIKMKDDPPSPQLTLRFNKEG